MKKIVLIMLMMLHNLAFAVVYQYTTDKFAVIFDTYSALSKTYKDVLVITDIDDTLLTMPQALGSVAWWDWQSNLLKKKESCSLCFARRMDDLLEIQSFLFSSSKMQLTETSTLTLFKAIEQSHGHAIALTARGQKMQSATEKALIDNRMSHDGMPIFSVLAPKLRDVKAGSNNVVCSNLEDAVTYHNGIIYLAGKNKGRAIRCLLKKIARDYKHILFIDDSLKNINHVYTEFERDPNVMLYNFYYTHERSKSQAFSQNNALKRKTFVQWQAIKRALHDNLKDVYILMLP